MRNTLAAMLVAGVAIVSPQTAQAALITFGNGVGEVNPAGTDTYAATVGGTNLQLFAETTLPLLSPVFTAGGDGLGITRGGGYDANEVESPEYFALSFAAPTTGVKLNLRRFFINEPQLFGGSFNEQGWLVINGINQPNFTANSATGLFTLDLTAFGAISSVRFAGRGLTNFVGIFPRRSHEFSLKSIEFDAATVPEPLTLTLLGMGFAATGYRLRRRRP